MKLHISWFTWLLWLVALLNGSWKPMLFLLLLMSLHEFCHCAMAALFHLAPSRIAVYPFGLCATMETLRWQPCLVQLCVLLAGPAVHFVTPLLLRLFLSQHWISPVFYAWCLSINTQLLIFNCLPIYPLDGAGMLLALLFGVFPVKTALTLLHLESLAMIAVVFLGVVKITPASVLIALALALLNFVELRKRAQTHRDACLYRLLEKNNYPLYFHNKNDFYLFRHNLYQSEGTVLDEKDWLWQFLGKKEGHDGHFMI